MTTYLISERAGLAGFDEAIRAAKTVDEIEAVFRDLFLVAPAPPSPTDYRDSRSDFGLKVRGIKARENLNAMARDILARVHDPEDLTEEDAEVLKQYSGRGGLTENSQFEYYTPTGVAEGMWDALRMHGFENGNVLDPCVGAGVFPATKPKGVLMTGADIDPVGSKIAQLFNPEDEIKTSSFESVAAATPDDAFDAVTGNVPFGDARGKAMHDDPAYKSEKRIERYFLLRAIDKVKPGGLVCLVVPVNIVGAKGGKWERWRIDISKKAEFLGAHKLPSKSFGAQGTDTVVDIVVLKKHPRDLLDRINDLPFETLKEARLIWDEFIQGRYWQGEGKRFIQGEYVPKVEGERWSREVVDGDIDAMAIKQKLAIRFDSRIDWGLLESAPAEIKNYIDGDQRIINGRQYEMRDGEWVPVIETKPDDTALDPEKYGVGTLAELKALLSSPDGPLQLTVDQLFAVYKTWPDLLSSLHKDAVEFAMSQIEDKYREQAFRGTILGGLLGRLRANPDDAERERLQNLVVAEIERFGHPKNSRLQVTGASSRAFGLFLNAVDEKGTFSDLLAGTLASEQLQFDPANIQSIVEHLFAREGIQAIELEDIQKLYSGGMKIESLGDLAAVANIALTPDGFVMPLGRFASGDVYPKIMAMTEAMADEDDDRIKAKYQEQIDLIKSRLKLTKPEDIYIGLQEKWFPKKYLIEFLRENGYPGVKFGRFETDMVEDPLDGKVRKRSRFVESDDDPFGHFTGIDDRGGFPKQFLKYLNGGKVTSSGENAQERIEAYKQEVKALTENFNAWLQQHEDMDQVARIYNRKFNAFIPYEYETDPLEIEGLSGNKKPHGFQCAAIRRLSEEGRGILGLDVGLGKAQPLDAKILTPDGWKLMGEINPGDMVIAADGSSVPVIGVFPQGEKEIFEVEFSDGAKTRCCDEHLWFTQTELDRKKERYARRNGKERNIPGTVKPLSEIRTTLVYQTQKNHRVPIAAPAQHPERNFLIDPYIMGVLIGDGCFRADNVTFTPGDDEIANNVAEIIKDRGLPVEVNPYRSSNRAQTWGLCRTNAAAPNVFRTELETLGLFGRVSQEKFVPEPYLYASAEQRLSLLRGLMDTDGYVSRDGITVQFSSSSERLANDVRQIVQSLGGIAWIGSKIPTYTHNGEKREGCRSYTVSMRLPAEMNPFRLARKVERVSPKSRYLPVRYIVRVESVGVQQAQCIMIDHPDHLYVTDDYIVTHNTFAAIGLHLYNKQMGRTKKTCITVPNSVLGNWYMEVSDLVADMNDVLFVGVEPKLDKEGNVVRELVLNEKGEPRVNKFTGETMTQPVLVKRNSPEDIWKKMWEIPTTSKALVVMTKEKFGSIPLRPETKGRYAEKMAERSLISDKLAESMMAGGGEGEGDEAEAGRRITYKDDKDRTRREGMYSDEGTVKKGELPFFEDMGFTNVIFDEAHEFKNSYQAGEQTSDIAYLPTAPSSKRALDMTMKTAFLREANDGRGVYPLTATPVTNSPFEIFNMLSYVAPMEEFERFGVYTVDDFVRVFGKIETVDKVMVSGDVKSKDGLTGFRNLDGLRNLFHKYTILKTADDVGLELPPHDELHEEVELTAEQKDIYDLLKEDAKDAAKPGSKVSMFSVIRQMDRITTDMDLYNRKMTFIFKASDRARVEDLAKELPKTVTITETDEEGKPRKVKVPCVPTFRTEGERFIMVVPETAEEHVAAKMGRHKIDENDVTHPLMPKYAKLVENIRKHLEADGKQIVFTEEKSQHRKIKRLLSHNIPLSRDLIGIINADEAEGTKLQRISDDYNSGRVKIIIANKKAEVGVNLQKGTTAIHHLTLPWTPASIQQRNGRGVRQGNTAAHIAIYYYMGKGSFDLYRLDLLQRKSSWMHDLFNGTDLEAENANALGTDDMLDLLAADPEEAKRRRLERLEKQKAEREARERARMVNTLQQLANVSDALAKIEPTKEAQRERLNERIPKLEEQIDEIKRIGAKLEPERIEEKKALAERLDKKKRELARAKRALDTLDADWDRKKADLEAKRKQSQNLLKMKAGKGELPFDPALVDHPENAVAALDGTLYAVGETYEVRDEAGRPMGIARIEKVMADPRAFTYEKVLGYFSLKARYDDKLKEAVVKLADLPPKGQFVKVAYSEKELALKRLLSDDVAYRALMDGVVDKETFYAHAAEIDLARGGFFVKTADGYAFQEGYRVKDNSTIVFPEPKSESFRKALAETYLKEMRGAGYASYEAKTIMKAVFGDDYAKAAEQYGNNVTEAEIRAFCADFYKNWLDENVPGGSSDPDYRRWFDQFGAFTSELKYAAMSLGDNREFIAEIASDVRDQIKGAVDAKYKELIEAQMAAEEEARAEREAAELARMKAHPNYKEVPDFARDAFAQLGIEVKINTHDTVLPGARRGRFKKFRDTEVGAFERWFFQDRHGKSGVLFRVKDILKARYGAQFFNGDSGDFHGAWWHIPSSAPLDEVYKLMI